jgi:hypothetical protein
MQDLVSLINGTTFMDSLASIGHLFSFSVGSAEVFFSQWLSFLTFGTKKKEIQKSKPRRID